MLLAILVSQEYLLTVIPQVQLTVILIIVFAQFLSYYELIPMIIAYVLLDNMLMGSLNLLYTPTMMIMWPLLAIIARRLRNKPDYVLFILAIVFPFIYGISFIPASIVVMKLDTWQKIWAYYIYDLPFEIAMSLNSVVTFLILYRPLNELLYHLFKDVYPERYIDDKMSL